jgi:hypothetical protein
MQLDSIFSKKQQYDKVNYFLKENFGVVIKDDIEPNKINQLISVIQQTLAESRNCAQDSDYAKNLLLKEALKLLREVSPSSRRVKTKVKESVDTQESLTYAIASKAMSAYKSSGKMPKSVKIDGKDYPVSMSLSKVKEITGGKQEVTDSKEVKESYEVTLRSEYKKTPTLESFQSLYEADLEEAEVLLAAKDLVDKLQKMVEDTASMQVEELLPLVDAMKERMGADKAEAFNSSVDSQLSSLLDMLKQTKDAVDNAVLSLSGDAPMPNMDADMGEVPAMDSEDEMSDMPADDLAGVDQMSGGEEDTLGRIPKESTYRTAMKMLLDNTSKGKVNRKILEQAKRLLVSKKKT